MKLEWTEFVSLEERRQTHSSRMGNRDFNSRLFSADSRGNGRSLGSQEKEEDKGFEERKV